MSRAPACSLRLRALGGFGRSLRAARSQCHFAGGYAQRTLLRDVHLGLHRNCRLAIVDEHHGRGLGSKSDYDCQGSQRVTPSIPKPAQRCWNSVARPPGWTVAGQGNKGLVLSSKSTMTSASVPKRFAAVISPRSAFRSREATAGNPAAASQPQKMSNPGFLTVFHSERCRVIRKRRLTWAMHSGLTLL